MEQPRWLVQNPAVMPVGRLPSARAAHSPPQTRQRRLLYHPPPSMPPKQTTLSIVVVAAAAARASLLLTDHRASSLAVNERARKCSRGHLPRRSGHTHAHPTHARTAMVKGGSRKRKEGGSIWTPRAPYKVAQVNKRSNQCNNL